jgi:mRNA-degrading endonuclease toxin of MazEF toxin-antitoxin module
LNRGEIRWYTFRPPEKRRPVLILTRSEVIDQLNEIIVAAATRTIRDSRQRWSCRRRTACPSYAPSILTMSPWANATGSAILDFHGDG